MVNYKVFSSYNVQWGPIFFLGGFAPQTPRFIVVLCWSTERLYHCRKRKIKYIQRRRRKFCGFLVTKSSFVLVYRALVPLQKTQNQKYPAPQAKILRISRITTPYDKLSCGALYYPPPLFRGQSGARGGINTLIHPDSWLNNVIL